MNAIAETAKLEQLIESLDDKTLHDWFDCVAPIVIYHLADLKYHKEAKNAFNRLMTKKRQKLFEAYTLSLPLCRKRDYNHPELKFDCYKHLFSEIMNRQRPDLIRFYDSYGAMAWKDADGNLFFAGDDIFWPPWYLNTKALLERLKA
jgi:hypothetical protein